MSDEKKRLTLPEGMIVNQSFYEKDTFDENGPKEGTPSYKFEVAIDPDALLGEGKFEDEIIDCACAEWGDSAEQDVLDGKIRWFLEGDDIAKDRKERGKAHDAYEGKLVIRGHTIYNRYGENAPGGISVYAPDVSRIEPAVGGAEIYRGVYGIVGVTLNPYITSESKEKRISFYLVAFQKTRDGERLSGGDNSDLFKEVGRVEGEGSKRRSRKG